MSPDDRINHLCILIQQALTVQKQMIECVKSDTLRLANGLMELRGQLDAMLDAPDWPQERVQ